MSITDIPGWKEMSAADLLAFSQSHPETRRPIKVEDLQFYLQQSKIAFIGLSGGWEGQLVDLLPNLPSDLRDGIVLMLAHIRNTRSRTVGTAEPEYAPLLPAITGVLGIDATNVYALGGGRKYPLFADESEAEAAKERALLLEFALSLSQRVTAAINLAADAEGATEESVKAAAVAEAST